MWLPIEFFDHAKTRFLGVWHIGGLLSLSLPSPHLRREFRRASPKFARIPELAALSYRDEFRVQSARRLLRQSPLATCDPRADQYDHGDAHAEKGFCNAISKALVTGEIKGNRFKATSFTLIDDKK